MNRVSTFVLALLGLMVAACGSGAAPSSSPAFTTLTGNPFSFGPTSIRYPVGWQAVHYDAMNSFYQSVAFLGPDALPDPCARYANGGSCQDWPPVHLGSDGIVVGLWEKSFPGWSFDPSAGEGVVIGGQRSTFAIIAPNAGCQAIGGDEQIVVTIPDTVEWNWWELDACLRGPDHTANEQLVRQMLGGIVAPSSGTAPASSSGPVPPTVAQPVVSVENSTTLAIMLVINGLTVATVPARSGTANVPLSSAPPVPWHVELRSASGRVLLTLDVPDNLVSRSARVDLSCGVLAIGTGNPIGGGPSAGAGTPGDCVP